MVSRVWTLKSVVEHELRDDIRGVIEQIVGPGVKHNSPEAFQHYQGAVSEVMHGLTDRERETYSIQAERWNQIGAPTEVKAL